jgi:NitT/TauT family transport system substrate-binding protein
LSAANIGEAAKIVAKCYGDTLLADIAPITMARLAKLKYRSRGNIDRPSIENVVKGLVRQGQWEGPIDWSKIIDDQFLPPDLKA